MHQLIEIKIALEFLIRVDLAFRYRILSSYLAPKSSWLQNRNCSTDQVFFTTF